MTLEAGVYYHAIFAFIFKKRHEKACRNIKKRLVFDSKRMRLQGTDAFVLQRKKSPPPPKDRVCTHYTFYDGFCKQL